MSSSYPAAAPYPSRLPFAPVPMHLDGPLEDRAVTRLREDLEIDVMVGVRHVRPHAPELVQELAELAAAARLWSELRTASIHRYVLERVAGTTVRTKP